MGRVCRCPGASSVGATAFAYLQTFALLQRAACAPPRPPVQLPAINYDALAQKQPAAVDSARAALTGLGAIVVEGVPAGPSGERFGTACARALRGLATCIGHKAAAPLEALHRELAGGLVRRTSIVAAGPWGRTDDLPRFSSCMSDDIEVASAVNIMRRGVRSATYALASALDTAGGVNAHPGTASGTDSAALDTDVSLVDIAETADHLEHIHLYEATRQGDGHGGMPLRTLRLHTDAGVLLAFVPPASHASSECEQGGCLPEVEFPGGVVHTLAPLPADSVIFFVGEAARSLYAPSVELRSVRPLPHGLAFPARFGWRVWYGTMLLLPSQTSQSSAVTGSDSMISDTSFLGSAGGITAKHRFSCGQGLAPIDLTGSCKEGEMYCWLQCMSIQSLENCSGGSWRPTGKGSMMSWSEIAPQCLHSDTGEPWTAGAMCPSCKPMCAESNAPGNNNSAPSPSPGGGTDSREGFCMGAGMVMYMDAFHWTFATPSAPCLYFLGSSIVLDSLGTFIVACIASVLLGLSVPVIAFAQSQLSHHRHLDLGIALQFLGLVAAYLAMLLIMTYSWELFFSVIAGMLLGRVLVTSLGKARNARQIVAGGPMFGETPCCCSPLSSPTNEGMSLERPLLTPSRAADDSATGFATSPNVVVLSVTGMTCAHCVGTVEHALIAVDGVRTATVELLERRAIVGFGPPCRGQEELCAAVGEVGFDAELEKVADGADAADSAAP